MKYAAAVAFAAVVTAAPAMAQQLAVAATEVNLRAGPDQGYPIVVILPPGAQVVVQGCLADYQWCDVTYGHNRGWAHAGGLHYPYQSRYVPLPNVASTIGIGVIGFTLGSYWDDHYRGRSWYHERDRWSHPTYRHRHGRDDDHRHGRRDNDRRDRDNDRRDRDNDRRDRDNERRERADNDSRQRAVPIGPQPIRPLPSVRSNDPNSGWDARNPNAPRADKP